jgi:hypothetical protein
VRPLRTYFQKQKEGEDIAKKRELLNAEEVCAEAEADHHHLHRQWHHNNLM